MRSLQSAVAKVSASAAPDSILVLPELVGGEWGMNELWWADIAAALNRRKQTALVGGRKTVAPGRYESGMYAIGAHDNAKYVARVPVPIGMWRPWASSSALGQPFGKVSVRIGSQVVGAAICYEQLLVLPLLVTMAEDPTVLVGTSNIWWARRTSIPDIQMEVMSAWARLLGLPLIYAANK